MAIVPDHTPPCIDLTKGHSFLVGGLVDASTAATMEQALIEYATMRAHVQAHASGTERLRNPRPVRRAEGRAPRRAARRAAVARAAAPPEPPAPEPPRRVGRVVPVAAPFIVSDLTCWAVAGMRARSFRMLVVERQIPNAVYRRHVYVRLDHLLAALGLSDGTDAPASSPSPVAWDENAVIAMAARPRRAP
jgi:hypothetical protein